VAHFVLNYQAVDPRRARRGRLVEILVLIGLVTVSISYLVPVQSSNCGPRRTFSTNVPTTAQPAKWNGEMDSNAPLNYQPGKPRRSRALLYTLLAAAGRGTACRRCDIRRRSRVG